jgi:DNA polymerase-3 subunit delta
MANPQHAFDILQTTPQLPAGGVCVLFGEQRFLMVETLHHLQRSGGDPDELQVVRFQSGEARWADLIDELDTQSLFGGGGPKLVVLDEADQFITHHREKLEELTQRSGLSGLLILLVSKWLGTTRLYKLVNQHGLAIDCNLPSSGSGQQKKLDETRISKWVSARAKQHHGLNLTPAAVTLLKELTGTELGRIEQELCKLALHAKPGDSIAPDLVQTVVGGWRTETMWHAIDAAIDGDAAASLRMLDKLFRNEEVPLALFGQIGWSLRRYVQVFHAVEAARLDGRKPNLRGAISAAGFRDWEAPKVEARMQQIGRTKLLLLADWLLTADQQLKRSHSHESRGRLVLEKLVLLLAERRTPATTAN